jgi:CBS domain-containing protein
MNNQLRDVMTRDVKMVGPESTIMEAARQMRDGDFGMMPVAEDDHRIVGAITDRDIAINAVAQGRDPRTTVREVMTADVVWAYEDDPVERGVEIMSKHQIRRLPVVDRSKRLVGIVALGDIATERAERDAAAEALSAISKP